MSELNIQALNQTAEQTNKLCYLIFTRKKKDPFQKKIKMAAIAMCDQVLQTLKYSNLNFVVQETPFSAYITIRKSFISGKVFNPDSGDISFAPSSKKKITEEKELLETRIRELETENENYASDLHNVSMKLEKAKKELSNALFEKETSDKNKRVSDKHLEENICENKILNNSIKKFDVEKQNLQNEIKTLRKDLKMKEKEIYRLQGIEDNSKDTIKRLKNKNSELTSEKKNFEKSKKKSEKKACKVVNVEEAIAKPVEEKSALAKPGEEKSVQVETVVAEVMTPELISDTQKSPSHTPPGTPPRQSPPPGTPLHPSPLTGTPPGTPPWLSTPTAATQGEIESLEGVKEHSDSDHQEGLIYHCKLCNEKFPRTAF